jgi:hypothetical protein
MRMTLAAALPCCTTTGARSTYCVHLKRSETRCSSSVMQIYSFTLNEAQEALLDPTAQVLDEQQKLQLVQGQVCSEFCCATMN